MIPATLNEDTQDKLDAENDVDTDVDTDDDLPPMS